MTLWLSLVAMAALAAGLVALPFLRARPEPATPTDATEMMKAELAQVARDQAVGEIDAAAAEAAKLEAERRLLAAAAPAPKRLETSARVDRITAGVVVGAVVLGAAVLYSAMGRPNTPGAPASAPALSPAVMTATPGAAPTANLPDVDTMISRLEARLQTAPNDAEGWRMLGWSYFETQRYQKAADAYAHAVKLNAGSAAFQSAYGEALTKAAGGGVTPEAKAAFETALKLDPADQRARTYLGLAPPPPGAAAQTATPAAAPNGDQQAMINGMVERQVAKLAASPRDRDGWVLLIRSRMALGQPDEARKALNGALTAFSDDPETQKRLRDAARELGVP